MLRLTVLTKLAVPIMVGSFTISVGDPVPLKVPAACRAIAYTLVPLETRKASTVSTAQR